MDNIGKNIDATAVLHKTATTLYEIKNYFQGMMTDLYKEASKDFATRFDECWKNIKKEYGDKTKKVKEGFLKGVSFKVMMIQSHMYDSPKQFMWAMLPVSEIIRRVFEHHYFYNSDLPDSERARLQKDEEYQLKVAQEVLKNAVRDRGGIISKPVFDKYNPVIYTARHLIDQYAQVLHGDLKATLKNEPDEYRFKYLLDLFLNAFWKAKNVFNQFLTSSPMDAAINWRTFFELEQTISVVNHYNYAFSKIYDDFAQFSVTDDIESNPELLEVMKDYAERFGKRVEDYGFKNYGWLLFIDEKLPLNFKSILKLNACEFRYDRYRDASKFVHYRKNPFEFDQTNVATFIIAEMYNSMSTLGGEFIKFCEYYNIQLSEEDLEQLKDLSESYDEATLRFIEQDPLIKTIPRS